MQVVRLCLPEILSRKACKIHLSLGTLTRFRYSTALETLQLDEMIRTAEPFDPSLRTTLEIFLIILEAVFDPISTVTGTIRRMQVCYVRPPCDWTLVGQDVFDTKRVVEFGTLTCFPNGRSDTTTSTHPSRKGIQVESHAI